MFCHRLCLLFSLTKRSTYLLRCMWIALEAAAMHSKGASHLSSSLTRDSLKDHEKNHRLISNWRGVCA